MEGDGSILEHYRFDTEVILGAGCLHRLLRDWCEAAGPSGALIFGNGHSVSISEQANIAAVLSSCGLHARTVVGACTDCSFEHLRQICATVDASTLNWVVAIGGGSVIDTGKVVALRGLTGFAIHETTSLEEFESRVAEFQPLPFLAAPTCLGAGAEVSALADVLVDAHQVRVPVISPVMYPKVAVVDCAVSAPPRSIQAAAIVDAATHLLDPWLNSLPGCIPQSETAIALLRSLVRLTREWTADRLDRASLLKLATISHLAVRPGLARPSAPVSVIHRIEHVLSPRLRCKHGEGLALLVPAFLRWMETSRSDCLIPVADQWAEVFGHHALPSILFTEWLTELGVVPCRLDTAEHSLDHLTDVVIKSFGNRDGLLPGNLSVGREEVRKIFRHASQVDTKWKSSVGTRSSLRTAVDTQRVFGGPLPKPLHVVMTPVHLLFEIACRSLGATKRDGWFPTAVITSPDHLPTLLVCPPPGGSTAEDCLQLLSSTTGAPLSVMFFGFAGALAGDLHSGDLVSPTHILYAPPFESSLQPRPLGLSGALQKDLCAKRSLTLRSSIRLTDETQDLLEAWSWGGVDLIDLEASGVARQCATLGTPFRAVLLVSDRPLDGSAIWGQPPMTIAGDRFSDRVQSLAAYLCEHIAQPTEHISEEAQDAWI